MVSGLEYASGEIKTVEGLCERSLSGREGQFIGCFKFTSEEERRKVTRSALVPPTIGKPGFCCSDEAGGESSVLGETPPLSQCRN